jgi:hypothetical protein
VERTPRFSYFVGYRRISPIDSNLIGGGINYEVNEKHRIGVQTWYDLDRGQVGQFDVAIVRKWPRFYTGLIFGLDNVEDNINISFSIWPEGAPGAVLGSRQFTSLAETTALRAEDD